MQQEISICCVGDISFEGAVADNPSNKTFADIMTYLKDADISIGNLESPLIAGGQSVPGKCTLRGAIGWAKILNDAGIKILSLANNHSMDYGHEGLYSTINALKAAGIRCVGAGDNKLSANQHIVIDIKGVRLAVLARTSVAVSSPSYATENKAGVAFMEIEETKAAIQRCRQTADIVILLIHWGLEEYSFPTPTQRKISRDFIDAGATLIVGHHPHVIQGTENIGSRYAAYSLGNFIFDEFEWEMKLPEGHIKKYWSLLSEENKRGIILRLAANKEGIVKISEVFTQIGPNCMVSEDMHLKRKIVFDKQSKILCRPFYNFFWIVYSIKMEWKLRIKKELSIRRLIKNLTKLRLKHIAVLLNTIRKSLRISAGKSTNPYE